MPEEKVQFDIRRELFEWAQALVSAIVIFVLIFTFVVRMIGVSGSSMEPTLHDGEKTLISNLFYKPKHGDVIMFTKKGLRVPGHGDSDQPLVKRVIGLPGDVVDIDFQTREVTVNGTVVNEPYVKDAAWRVYDVQFPVTVPDGCVFVMGDNREVSYDSRASSVGMIDKRYILGKVLMRVYPINKIGIIK